jgi:hypothetical protein
MVETAVTKRWWESKTIWLGITVFVASLGPLLTPLLPPKFAAAVGALSGMAIVANRTIAGNPPIVGAPNDPTKEINQ